MDDTPLPDDASALTEVASCRTAYERLHSLVQLQRQNGSAAAAEGFLGALSGEQKTKATMTFEDPQRTDRARLDVGHGLATSDEGEPQVAAGFVRC